MAYFRANASPPAFGHLPGIVAGAAGTTAFPGCQAIGNICLACHDGLQRCARGRVSPGQQVAGGDLCGGGRAGAPDRHGGHGDTGRPGPCGAQHPVSARIPAPDGHHLQAGRPSAVCIYPGAGPGSRCPGSPNTALLPREQPVQPGERAWLPQPCTLCGRRLPS